MKGKSVCSSGRAYFQPEAAENSVELFHSVRVMALELCWGGWVVGGGLVGVVDGRVVLVIGWCVVDGLVVLVGV